MRRKHGSPDASADDRSPASNHRAGYFGTMSDRNREGGRGEDAAHPHRDMTGRNPIARAWRSLVRRASAKLIERQRLSPEARLGRSGEDAAYWHLRNQGIIMVAKNYRPAGLRGEIDLIGWDRDVLVFV